MRTCLSITRTNTVEEEGGILSRGIDLEEGLRNEDPIIKWL